MALFLLSLLCFLSWDYGQLRSGATAFDLYCNNTTDCIDNSNCVLTDGFCECLDGYQFAFNHNNEQICAMCPEIHQPCDANCCYPPDITVCIKKVCQCNENYYGANCSDMDKFKLATQIALGSAVLLSIACILIILWKSCMRRRELMRRLNRPEGLRTNSSNSLTSGQRVIVERLRHRPPGYYDRGHIRIEKPPTYEESVEQPLRFPILNINSAGVVPVSQQIPLEATRNTSEIRSDVPRDSSEISVRSPAEGGGGHDNLAFVLVDEKEASGEAINASEVTPSDQHM